GDDRHAVALHELPRLRLRAHGRDRLRLRPDEDDPRVVARRRQLGPFAEKAVAGMERIRAAGARRVDDLTDVEVRLTRGAAAEGDRFVEEAADEADVVALRI